MEYIWILICYVGVFNIDLLTAHIAVKPMFYALDNPCMEKYRLCPVVCSVVTLKNDVQCQFCFCKDATNNIAWGTSTVPLTHNRVKPPTTSALLPQLQTTSVVPLPTTRSPYLTVNNITYATLQNPCEPTQAMCPIKCEMSNVSYHNRICENCYCSLEITKSFGRRSKLFPIETVTLEKQQNSKQTREEKNLPERKMSQKRCMPLFCPFFRCPVGQHFEKGYDGCRTCRCVEVQNTYRKMRVNPHHNTNNGVHHQHHSGTPPDISHLFCLPSPEYCPGVCRVHNITVDDWHCYFCRCPQGETFLAMINPCSDKVLVCPSKCTIKQEVTRIILESTHCDYCDCNSNTKTDFGRSPRLLMDDFKIGDISTAKHCLQLPGDCPTHCHLTTVHSNQWKCHVCVCNGVLIPKAFIHHFLRTTKHSTVIWHSKSTFPATSAYTTKIQSTSEQPTTTVIPSIIPPSPLPSLHQTSYPDMTTHSHTNPPEASISCFICNDTVCGDQDLQQCTKDTKYCMNTFTQYPDGTKTINRRCATETDCNKKWWLTTADDAVCLSLENHVDVEIHKPKECNFCCTVNGCNKKLQIEDHIFIGKE